MRAPDELRARVLVLVHAPRVAAVLQRQLLQQLEVHVTADADGEDADPAAGGRPGAVEDREGVGLPHGGLPVREEDDEGHAAVCDAVAVHVVVEQLDGPLQGPMDVCACGTPKQGGSRRGTCPLHQEAHPRPWSSHSLPRVSRSDVGTKSPVPVGDSSLHSLSRHLASVC